MVVGGRSHHGQAPRAVIVRDAGGHDVAEPEPVRFRMDDVAEHVPASVLGISPTSILDKVGVSV